MASKPSTPIGILPHSAHLESIPKADFEAHRADAKARVLDAASFKAMQSFLLNYYDGMEIEQSFADDAGQVFDCVPIHQQPSIKGTNKTLATAPDLSGLSSKGAGASAENAVVGPFGLGRLDRHGNAMGCPPGTIPLRRITLDQLARFPTLNDFHTKRPRRLNPLGRPDPIGRPAPASVTDGHLHAQANQVVGNTGGHSFLALAAPVVGDNQFSLSQHWYTAGSGSALQTAEVGWMVSQTWWGTTQPILFVYWTNNGYDPSNPGAYNLSQSGQPGFQQTNSAWGLGGALSPVSQVGGQQYEIEALVYLYQGNWWLYLGGTSASNAIGYWPTSLYNGGAMSVAADNCAWGGEIYSAANPQPPMGEGNFASAGWLQAAYHRDIYYFPSNGGSAQWAQLSPYATAPSLYTIATSSAADPWNVYFFYGGPGGNL
ncbi:MAG: neprosin family prolyl endopeptidase [Roseiarcus sp.]|jgi:hypothetical protein